jgi:DNA-binding MarR family transcriptional regulator
MSSIKYKSPTEQSYELLIKCMMQFKHSLGDLGLKHGLTTMQSMVLVLLDTPRPMNNFKKIFSCDASNVTGIVDGLEEKKLAARFPDNNDRRIKMVRLSQKGEDLRKKLLSRLAQDNGSIHLNLSSNDIKTFVKLLKKVADSSSSV